MKDFSLRQVLGLLARTTPFLVFRFLIYFAITLTYFIVTGVGAGIGYFVGTIGDDPGAYSIWGGILGFSAASAVMYLVREYLLYLVKAGHIAVLVELMEGNAIPGGKGQISHAQRVVRERFAESSALFAVDQLIKGVLKAFNRTFFSIAALLPIPGAAGIVKFVNTVLNLSLTYLDEVILAYHLRSRSDNPWQSGQEGLVLYAQNYKSFLKNAFFLALVIWGLTFGVFLVVLAPVAGLVSLFPGTAGPLTVLVAVVFAWGIKQAVIEPIAMTALMHVFFKVTAGQTPDAEWESRLDTLSTKFRTLKEKALSAATARPQESAARPASASLEGPSAAA